MVRKVLIMASLFGATCAAPACGVWGSVVRSWTLTGTGITSVIPMRDGYVVTARWTSFTGWYVYTSTGSFVRSVAASGVAGVRDGSMGCHLGAGYFVTIDRLSGVSMWTYTNGGFPGTSPVGRPVSTALGRGVSWDGTYYFATTGNWGSPIGMYTTTGSLVGTFPLSYYPGLYGHAMAPGYDYFDIAESSRNMLYHLGKTTGSVVRSLAVAGPPAGLDIGADGYLYAVVQGSPGRVLVLATDYNVGLRPASVGRIKTLFR